MRSPPMAGACGADTVSLAEAAALADAGLSGVALGAGQPASPANAIALAISKRGAGASAEAGRADDAEKTAEKKFTNLGKDGLGRMAE